jgi:hypothetical protein
MGVCPDSDGENFCDTNCLFITRAAFGVLSTWALMDRAFHAIDDRVVWQAIIQQNYSRAHTGCATVAYRARLANFYNAIGETPPENVKVGQIETIWAALSAWEAAGHPSLRRQGSHRADSAGAKARERIPTGMRPRHLHALIPSAAE